VGCASPWPRSADLRGLARGPGACDEYASGLGVACVGPRPLSAWRPGGVFRGGQAQAWPQCSGGSTPGPGTPGGSQGDGPRAGHAAQGLQSLDHRGQTPGWHGLVECVREPWEACGRRLPCADVFWKNIGWRGRGPDHVREPPQGGRAPRGPAGVAEIVVQHKGFQTAWGVFASTDGICTRPGEVAPGFLVDRGDRDHRASA